MKHVEMIDLPDDAREIVRESELRGERTRFERDGRPVAVLVSWDEYLALRETLDILNDSLLYAQIESAEEEVRKNKILQVEDLLESNVE